VIVELVVMVMVVIFIMNSVSNSLFFSPLIPSLSPCVYASAS
jgi:hypothetical protein